MAVVDATNINLHDMQGIQGNRDQLGVVVVVVEFVSVNYKVLRGLLRHFIIGLLDWETSTSLRRIPRVAIVANSRLFWSPHFFRRSLRFRRRRRWWWKNVLR